MEDGTLADLLDFRFSQKREPSVPGEFVQIEITKAEVDLPPNFPVHLIPRILNAPEFPT